MWSHWVASSLVTVTKSVPKNTPVTPATENIRSASGEAVGGLGRWEISRSGFQHDLSRQEFQRRGVRRGFGLDEHEPFPRQASICAGRGDCQVFRRF